MRDNPTVARDLRHPSRVGPYEIAGVLGSGGMGSVYRAHDPRLHRDVALKLLHSSTGEAPERLERFLAEARAVGSLNHPNILAIHDVGMEADTPYIVAELVDGRSLRQELGRGPLAVTTLLDLATQIADGLAAAHQAGIIHRDLKPENVMVTRAGRVKIVDFGLAKRTDAVAATLEPQRTLTAAHVVIGTPSYMSPEQARGAPLDFRSDLFSFGAMLYEMASGRRAFERPTAIETLTAILHDEPPPLQEVNPRTPAPLQWIVQRCLAKTPGDRYAATADLHHDLRMLRDRLTSVTGGAGAMGRRRLPPVGLVAGSLVAGALLAAVALLVGDSQPLPFAAHRFLPLATDAGYEGSAAWAPDGRTIAYVAERDGLMQVMTRSLDSSRATQVTSAAADCRYPFWAPDGRRIYYISLAADRESLWSVGVGGGARKVEVRDVSNATLAPDGSALVFLRDEAGQAGFAQSLWVAAPPGSEPRRFAPDWSGGLVADVSFLRFSPDGSRVALWAVPTTHAPDDQPLANSAEVWLFGYPDGRAHRVFPSLARIPRPHPFSWLGDSRHLVFGADFIGRSPGTHLWVGDTVTGRVQPLVVSSVNEYEPDVSPDGQRIAFTTETSHYDVLEVPLDGSAPRAIAASTRQEADPVWAPSGRQFAYVTDRSGAQEIWHADADGTFDVPAVTSRNFTDGDTYLLSRPAFSRDGQRLAYQRRSADGYTIWVSPLAGGPAAQLFSTSQVRYADTPAWSPDDEWIAFTYMSEGEGRWRLGMARPGGSEFITILEDVNFPTSPQWSADGRWIACQLRDGLYAVSQDGRQRRRISEELWLAHAWAPDGRSLVAVRQTDDNRLELARLDVETPAEPIVIRDLGPSPPTTPQLRGFSLSPDGRRLLTSVIRLRGDIHLLEGFAQPAGIWERMRRAFWRRPGEITTSP